MEADRCDVLVIGSGSAALSAALRAANGGLAVVIVEKSELLGGTSAMSGAGIWVPANHLAQKAGVADSRQEALRYIRSASPSAWREDEDRLWQAFVDNAPPMLAFLERATPLRFELVDQPDPFSECPGGKRYGRMLSPKALSRNLLGQLSHSLRRSSLPHAFTYREIFEHDLEHHIIRTVLKLGPKLLRRYLANAGGQGTALVTGLLKGCLDAGCQVWMRTEATALLTDGGGVIGAELRLVKGATRTVLARHAVVVASGGFEWDAELMRSHFPGPRYRIGSSPSNTGDGQKMVAAIGARLDRMDQANVYVCYPSSVGREHKGLPAIFHAAPHSILVNRNARRFISEGDFNLGAAVDRRDERARAPLYLPVWLIADARFLKAGLTRFQRHATGAMERFVVASSLEELAEKTRLPADALTETVQRFNCLCHQGSDSDFRRGQSIWERSKTGVSLGPIERPPFVAVEMDRFIVGTKGGARTNERGQVLRPDGSVIAGLYAAGLAMANPIGSRGISAGTTLGPNLTWGYICAETILANLEQ